MTRALLPALSMLLLAALPARAQPAADSAASGQVLYLLTADSLEGGKRTTRLPYEWRFSPGDRTAFARPGYDDSGWKTADAQLIEGRMPDGWDGLGWFRLHFRVDSSLTGVPLGLRFQHHLGASETYLDGKRLFSLGKVGETAGTTDSEMQRLPHVFTIADGGEHVLAVRYANHQAEAFHESVRTNTAGFDAAIGAPNRTQGALFERMRLLSIFQMLFVGVLAAFALLHLTLFAFNPQQVENVLLALLIGALAVFAYLLHQQALTTHPVFAYVYFPKLARTAFLLILSFGLLFVYQLFYDTPPRLSYFVPLLGAAGIVLSWFFFARSFVARLAVLLIFAAAFVETLRVIGVALYRKKSGARVVGLGITVLTLGLLLALLGDTGVLEIPLYVALEAPFVGAVFLTAALSVYLSRETARTSRRLRRELERVQILSRQKAEQERKLEELEEARQLQLSMLPQQMPALDGYEIAAHMETAEEVGGDYYDFDFSEEDGSGDGADGSFTFTIGDATGHGLSAGTMVTATKSLFQAMGSEADLLPMLRRAGRALKKMNLRRLYMALTVARLDGNGRLRLATAGMPPALVYRAASGQVETIRLKGMPLGSFPDFPYRERELTLDEGDAVLLMSDGFPERFNPAGEMLGYERAAEVLAGVGHAPAQAIIDRFVEESERWANGRPTDDDLTFVVLKRCGVEKVRG